MLYIIPIIIFIIIITISLVGGYIFKIVANQSNYISELEKQSLVLAAQSERLLTVASIINHDLRNSVENIEFASSELTRMIEDHDYDIINEVEEILRVSSQQQLQRLNSVRDLMKNIRQQENIQKTSTNLLECLNNLIEREGYMENIILDRSLDINLELNIELFETIVDNLIKNGINHNDSINKIISIFFENGYIIFEDNGKGFDVSQFDYLKQYNTKGVDSSGSGQGLYIINSTISILGWKLEVENTGWGSRFKIKI